MKNAELYWGDILVQTCTWEEHLKTLQELFRRLAQAGMTIRPSKCTFGSASIDFPGHEDNVAKIRTAPRPTTQEAGSILYGIGRILPRFHPQLRSYCSHPLWPYAKGSTKWSNPILTSDPILRLPDPEKTFVLRTDALDYGIGAVLIQEHEGKLFLICYASKKLSDAEGNYSTIEKECLAVVCGIERFHVYLYGVRFVLQTDHELLKYMNRAKFTNNRLMRWAMFLQSYNKKVEAMKGSDIVEADYLSRVMEWGD